MKNTLKIFVIVLVLMIGYSCGFKKIGKVEKDYRFSNQEQELEYYYAFTEATKQAMFNNYKDAINLYNKCLKYNPESAATHFQLSNIYMRMGEIDVAKDYARNAIKRDGSNIWYYLHLAAIYQMQGNIDSTIIMYEQIVDLDKSRIEYLFNLALLYKEGKYYEKSLKELKKIEGSMGVSERLIYLKHDLYNSLGRKKDAINELKKGITLFPENINMYGLLAEYYSEIGEMEEADKVYQIILGKDSANSKALLSYADYLIETGRIEKAFKFYTDAIEDEEMAINDKIMIVISLINDERIFTSADSYLSDLIDLLININKDNLDTRLVRIDFNIKRNNYENAGEDLKFILRKKPDNLNAWKQLIYIENFMNHYDSVIILSEEASGIFKSEPTFYIMKGLAYLQKGENEKAIKILLEAEGYSVNDEEKVQIYGYLAELYRNIGYDSESDKYFEKALNIDDTNIFLRNNYSYYLALRDTALRKAEKLSKYTIEAEPLNATYLDTYAWILYKMGKYKLALKYIEIAVKRDDENNAEILDHYGDILMKLNRYEKAIEVWKKVLQIADNKELIEQKIYKANEFMIRSR